MFMPQIQDLLLSASWERFPLWAVVGTGLPEHLWMWCLPEQVQVAGFTENRPGRSWGLLLSWLRRERENFYNPLACSRGA